MTNTLVHSPYIVKQHLTHHTRAGSRRTLTAWMAKHRLPTGLFCFFGAPRTGSARRFWCSRYRRRADPSIYTRMIFDSTYVWI